MIAPVKMKCELIKRSIEYAKYKTYGIGGCREVDEVYSDLLSLNSCLAMRVESKIIKKY